MLSFRLTALRARVLCYSTENPAKVRKALSNLLGDTNLQLTSKKVEGYYGDPIYIIEFRTSDSEIAGRVFSGLLRGLGGLMRLAIEEGLEMTSKEHGRIHLRLDKQAAYQGRYELCDADAVKLEFSFEGDPREVFEEEGQQP